MSIWQTTIVDGMSDKEHNNYNAFAWQQLLNSLHLGSESDSTSEDGVDTTPGSCPTTTIRPKQSNASPNEMTRSVKLDAYRTSSSGGSPVALPEHGYSGVDEHESPGDQIASGRSTTPLYAPPSNTFTTKSGSGGFAVSTQNGSDATVPCFLNGEPRSIEAPRKTPDWTATLSSPPSSAKKVFMESSRWTSAPVDQSNTPAKTVVAGNASSGRSGWARTTKSAKQSKSSMSPPPYPKAETPATGYAVPASPQSSGMRLGVQNPFARPNGLAAYLANTTPTMLPFQASALPTAQQGSIPPLFRSNSGSTANTFSDSLILGFVFMDGEGRLHLASQDRTPSASAPSAVPMMHVPGGATAPSGVPQVNYTPSTVQAQPWRPVAAPSVSLPWTASSEFWGNTKAWVFLDSRWISLTIMRDNHANLQSQRHLRILMH